MSEEKGLRVEDIRKLIKKEDNRISIGRQTELLGISRASLYYEPAPVNERTLKVMNLIDEIYTAWPFYGSRRMAAELSDRMNEAVNRKMVQRIMLEMGLEAIYPKPNLSLNGMAHPTYPYLLRGLAIVRPNHVWGSDITYIRMRNGFLYLTAILDWYSRFVMGWRLSTTLDTDFCLTATQDALKFGQPEISNTDQGVQFTSQKYLEVWKNLGVQISMDGRGRALDNIFTERLWRSLKYEEVYLKSYASVAEAEEGISRYFKFYNYERKHQSLGYKTPAQIYLKTNP